MAMQAASRSFGKTKYELSACPICSSNDGSEVADREAIQQETERVWSFHARRFRHPVPPKYLMDRVVFSQSPPLRLLRCAVCTHLYRSPRESAETVRRTYAETALSESVYESLFDNQRLAYRAQVRRLRDFVGKIHRGLEVGSYIDRKS